jgi:hypothetical protein
MYLPYLLSNMCLRFFCRLCQHRYSTWFRLWGFIVPAVDYVYIFTGPAIEYANSSC